MCKTGLSHEDAFTFVQNRRFCVAPRIEFQHQIEVSAIFLSVVQVMCAHQDVSLRPTDQSFWRAKQQQTI